MDRLATRGPPSVAVMAIPDRLFLCIRANTAEGWGGGDAVELFEGLSLGGVFGRMVMFGSRGAGHPGTRGLHIGTAALPCQHCRHRGPKQPQRVALPAISPHFPS